MNKIKKTSEEQEIIKKNSEELGDTDLDNICGGSDKDQSGPLNSPIQDKKWREEVKHRIFH